MDALTTLLIMEACLGLLAGVFGIFAARSSWGGTLAGAILWIVVGQITMSVGHLIMVFDMLYGTTVFMTAFGNPIGGILFRIAVVFSLGSSLFGFYRLWALTRKTG